MPDQKKARFLSDFGLSPYDAEVLVAEKERSDYFEALVQGGAAPKAAANLVINEFMGRLNREGLDFSEIPVPTATGGTILSMIADGTISGKIAKDVLDIVWSEGGDPRQIVEERGLKQVTDTGEIEKVIDEVIAANPKQVEQVKAKPKTLGWFVGQVMQKTGGKANPQAVNKLLREKLDVADA